MSANPIPSSTEEDLARFMGKILLVDLGHETPCWAWQSTKFRQGYGCFTINSRAFRAHRVLWTWEKGYEPKRPLDHLCHDPATCAGGETCPHRACVNPEHLVEVTQRDNVIRGTGPSAVNALKTQCAHGHPFDEANTYIDPSTGWRQCRTCKRENVRRLADADRAAHNAKRRARRKRVVYDPRPCEACGETYQPLRSTSRFCETRACLNARQNANRRLRKGMYGRSSDGS